MTRLVPVLCGLTAMLFAATARADYQTTFSTPPYTVGTTVVGVDGWTASAGTNASVANGLVVNSPWDPTDQSLILKRGTAAGTTVRVVNSSFAPLAGEVRVTATLAFDFPTGDSDTATTIAFQDTAIGGSPISFGLSYAAGGGIYYTGSGSQVVVLSKNQIKLSSPYVFTLDIDIPNQVFGIQITGLKVDDTPFSYSLTGIESGAFTGDVLSTLYVGNTANNTRTSYLSEISVQAIPEPSSALLGLLAVSALTCSLVRKRSKK